MLRNNLVRLIYLFATLIVIFFAVYALLHSKIFADDLGGGNKMDLNFSGSLGKKTVETIINGNVGKIQVNQSLFSSCSVSLTGFQKEAKIQGLVDFSPKIKAVEVRGIAGVHAENRQYFSVDGNSCPRPVAFVKNGIVSYNIYSDEPHFIVQDFNEDGFVDIASEYRNYDLDPILDGIRDIYLFTPGSQNLIFNRSEIFKYNQTNENQ